jgi:glutamate synthase (NADPH/NADH) small chain
MACAQQLVRAGHAVTLFEQADRIGGLLRYGIPDFKMEKELIDRRVEQMRAEGVEFRTSVEIGVDVSVDQLAAEYDALALTGGAELPRDLEVPGRELAGIHFAMNFLPQQNKRVAGTRAVAAPGGTITATGKHVVVIGGGDTGSDCIGTSTRQGARSITQLEILPKPPDHEDKALVWPDWPLKLRTSSSQEEGCERDWAVLTKRALGANGQVEALECVRVEWMRGGRPLGDAGKCRTARSLRAEGRSGIAGDGVLGPRKGGMIEQAEVKLDPRGNVATPTRSTTRVRCRRSSPPARHAAQPVARRLGDPAKSRQCARAVDEFLMGSEHPAALISGRKTSSPFAMR